MVDICDSACCRVEPFEHNLNQTSPVKELYISAPISMFINIAILIRSFSIFLAETASVY